MDIEKTLSLLIIEDSEDDALLIIRDLQRSGLKVSHERVETESSVLRALGKTRWDIVISDFNMPNLTGLRALELVRSCEPDLPFILVSGSIGEQLAVQAMKAGAQDYIMKDNLARLAAVVRREIEDADERRQRRKAEAALAEKEKQLIIAQRMEAIGRLAGGIAHDLNNVIGACKLYTEIALNPDQGIAEIRESVQQIEKAQDRAIQLVRQLLAFSRKQVIDPQVISLNQVIIDISKMLAQILGEDIELVLELEADLPQIKADPSQVDQVIMNLVVNARDAMPKGGMLSIRTRSEQLDPDSRELFPGSEPVPGEYVRLTVTDTGTGMDEGTKARLFEPFFTTKEIGKGTGLGLATVYGIVKQAHGEIHVQSELGKGTSFDIYFRPTDEVVLRGEPTRVSRMSQRTVSRRTILLVEDDPAIQIALHKVLGQIGYQLRLATNGAEGLEVFETCRGEIDLLISDVVMPKMSGPDMASAMRKQKPSLPVLFLSGYADDTLSSYGVDHRSTFLLAKPFGVRQVAEKIRGILGDDNA